MRTTLAAAALLAVGALLGWLAAPGRFATETRAQDKATAKPPAETSQRPADEKAIREAAQALARAFEKGDAKAVAAFWTEDGEYVEEGGAPVRGRDALAKAYADFFAKRPAVKAEAKTE